MATMLDSFWLLPQPFLNKWLQTWLSSFYTMYMIPTNAAKPWSIPLTAFPSEAAPVAVVLAEVEVLVEEAEELPVWVGAVVCATKGAEVMEAEDSPVPVLSTNPDSNVDAAANVALPVIFPGLVSMLPV